MMMKANSVAKRNKKEEMLAAKLTFSSDFGLVGFYSISTIVSYLMLNPLYTYILNI